MVVFLPMRIYLHHPRRVHTLHLLPFALFPPSCQPAPEALLAHPARLRLTRLGLWSAAPAPRAGRQALSVAHKFFEFALVCARGIHQRSTA